MNTIRNVLGWMMLTRYSARTGMRTEPARMAFMLARGITAIATLSAMGMTDVPS